MRFFDTHGTPGGASIVERIFFEPKQPLWQSISCARNRKEDRQEIARTVKMQTKLIFANSALGYNSFKKKLVQKEARSKTL